MRSLLLLLLLFVSSIASIPSPDLGLQGSDTLDSSLWDIPFDESDNAILPIQLDMSFVSEGVYGPSLFSTDLWASEDNLAFKLDDSVSPEYPTVPDKTPFGLPVAIIPSKGIPPCTYLHTFCSSLSPSDTYIRPGDTTITLRNAKRCMFRRLFDTFIKPYPNPPCLPHNKLESIQPTDGILPLSLPQKTSTSLRHSPSPVTPQGYSTAAFSCSPSSIRTKTP